MLEMKLCGSKRGKGVEVPQVLEWFWTSSWEQNISFQAARATDHAAWQLDYNAQAVFTLVREAICDKFQELKPISLRNGEKKSY